MVAEPARLPVTIPVKEPTGAIPLLLLLHSPPLVALVKVVVFPTHIEAEDGDIATGVVFTDTVFNAEQPAALV